MKINARSYHIQETFVLLVISLLHQSKMGNSISATSTKIVENPDQVTYTEGDVAILYCSVLNLGDSTKKTTFRPNVCTVEQTHLTFERQINSATTLGHNPVTVRRRKKKKKKINSGAHYETVILVLNRNRKTIRMVEAKPYTESPSLDYSLPDIPTRSAERITDNTAVTWRKMPNSSPLTIGNKSWVRDRRVHAEHVPYSSHWNLVIEKVRMEDAGEYECQVNKRQSQLRQRVTLLVKESNFVPMPRIEISGQNVVKAGHLLQLTCDAILMDLGVDTVSWTKDGMSLLQSKDDRYRVHTSVTINGRNSGVVVSKLEIKDTRQDDSGVYLCGTSEKAQMAGVKVEIQGAHHLKRADKKRTDQSHTYPKPLDQSAYSKTTSCVNLDLANLQCRACILVVINLVYCVIFIT